MREVFEADFIAQLQGLNRAIVEQDMESFERYVRSLSIVLRVAPTTKTFSGASLSIMQPHLRRTKSSFTPEYIAQARSVMNPKDLGN